MLVGPICSRPGSHRTTTTTKPWTLMLRVLQLLATITTTAATALFDDELLSERCRTDDLTPSFPTFSFLSGSVNSKVLELDVFINCSEPSCSWTSGRSPLVSGWTKRGNYDAVVIFR